MTTLRMPSAGLELTDDERKKMATVPSKQSDHEIRTGNTKRTFDRHRTVEELRRLSIANGWLLETAAYDKEGSDYVTLQWRWLIADRMYAIPVTINTFNGRFIAMLNGEMYTEESNIDGTLWFDHLLDAIYVMSPTNVRTDS